MSLVCWGLGPRAPPGRWRLERLCRAASHASRTQRSSCRILCTMALKGSPWRIVAFLLAVSFITYQCLSGGGPRQQGLHAASNYFARHGQF